MLYLRWMICLVEIIEKKCNYYYYIFDNIYPNKSPSVPLKDIFNRLKVKHYQRKINKLLKVNFIDDYDILMEIFEKEEDVISIMSRFDEYDRDKQILIKILLNINKSLRVKDI